MADWQITATTIYCDVIDDEATILLYIDGTTKCTGYAKYSNPSREAEIQLKKRSKKLNKILKCDGPQCRRVTEYKDKLFAEDSGN